jgi:hypothetical protein
MASNQLKTDQAPGKKEAPQRTALLGSFSTAAIYLFENIQFVFYLAFLGVIYIANSHYTNKSLKQIQVLQEELRKIGWESNSRKSDLMIQSMQSKVAQKVEHLGLRPLEEQPYKIKNK